LAVTTPDWLTRRGGSLTLASDGRTWFVGFDKEAMYRVRPVPAGGKYACEVSQTINGKRLDAGAVHPSLDDAVRGGLDDLRKALGW
jgi:hypothetical protein